MFILSIVVQHYNIDKIGGHSVQRSWMELRLTWCAKAGSMFSTSCLVLVLIVGLSQEIPLETQDQASQAPPEVCDNGIIYATCEMKPSNSLPKGQPEVNGQVRFKQVYPDGLLHIKLNLHGFLTRKDAQHGIHIHTYADLYEGCHGTGSHFNPQNKSHPNHLGDLGNCGSHRGSIHMQLTARATLFGSQSVLGRSLVIHEREDNMGMTNGNAGQPIACCVIGLSRVSVWEETGESSGND